MEFDILIQQSRRLIHLQGYGVPLMGYICALGSMHADTVHSYPVGLATSKYRWHSDFKASQICSGPLANWSELQHDSIISTSNTLPLENCRRNKTSHSIPVVQIINGNKGFLHAPCIQLRKSGNTSATYIHP